MLCRSCGYELAPFFSLGKMPLANALLTSPDQEAPRYPLALGFCQACTLVQLMDTVPPEDLFTTYDYLSACCPPVEAQAADLVQNIETAYTPNFVVEIGSNDGYLLSHYHPCVKKLGIEPAWNVLQHARRERYVSTLWEFFSAKTAEMVVKLAGQAEVIHANNVMAHCPDINDFMKGIKILLRPGGVCVIEVPWIKDMIENRDFTSIYCEHVYYFSIAALNSLVVRQGLRLVHAEHIGAQGGSLRLYIHTQDTGTTPALRDLLIAEATAGAHTLSFYQEFAAHAKDRLLELQEIDFESQYVVGFGAPAKATVLLNMLPQWFSEKLGYTVDDTPEKQGRFIPGVRLPIHPVSHLLADKPDAVLVLCWNHRQAVIDRLRREGYAGKFIFPLPKLEVVS